MQEQIIAKIKKGIENAGIVDKSIEILKQNLAQKSEALFNHSLRTALLVKKNGR